MSSALSNLAGLTLSTASASTSCWEPLSHWTRRRPPGKSSTTHPRTKAVAGSLSQTYRLPEKSFSPSTIPPNFGVSWPSSEMNCGANVPTGVLLRCEFDRNRVDSFRPSRGLLSCVSDWLRAWFIFESGSARGDEKTPDLGRRGPGTEFCEGEGVFLANGLLRELRANGRPF